MLYEKKYLWHSGFRGKWANESIWIAAEPDDIYAIHPLGLSSHQAISQWKNNSNWNEPFNQRFDRLNKFQIDQLGALHYIKAWSCLCFALRIHSVAFQRRNISFINTCVAYENHIQFFMNQKTPIKTKIKR